MRKGDTCQMTGDRCRYGIAPWAFGSV